MQKNEFCNKATMCKKSGLTKMVLLSTGCTKATACSDFIKRGENIKEKILPLTISCSAEKCHRDNREKTKDECIDCMDLKLGVGNKHRKIEFQFRCVREYCIYENKEKIDKNCLECENIRIFSADRHVWVFFRGGKDLKGNSFARKK